MRLSAEQVSPRTIGLVSAAYFGGLVLGAFVNARLIIRVGHIRAYAAYASLLCFLFLLHGMVVDPHRLDRAAVSGGFAAGGIFVVLGPGCWFPAPRPAPGTADVPLHDPALWLPGDGATAARVGGPHGC